MQSPTHRLARRERRLRSARRYAPFAALAAGVGVAVAVLGADGGNEGNVDRDGADTSPVEVDSEELVRSGPMTPQKAELLGDDVDFGPDCDAERGTIRLPTLLAPPCVAPFAGDNGGDTSPGVTADEIKVVYYQTDPALDPAGAALIGATGADVDPDSAARVVADLAEAYNQVFETYGRRVVVDTYTATGAGDDRAAARRDAMAIAEMEPFAVVGGPQGASPVFAGELAAGGVVCGPRCTGAVPEALLEDNAPYLWPIGPTPDQAAAMTAEVFGKLAGPGPAELAGDPELRERERVYALVHYDNPDGDHEAVFQQLRDQLADNGIELATDVEFTLDTTRMQESARTIISRLESAGVTTVIYYGDPLTPGALTHEATAQDYHPEWLLGPSTLMDTTVFARQADPEQWRNGFGVSFTAARGEGSATDPWRLYEWAFGEPPANNTVGLLEPPLRTVFTGIHLAGPDLTPETFRDGLFRSPVVGGSPTAPQVSRGDHGIWPGIDYGGSDDAAIIWWDPDESGEDETGNLGQGMYRYAAGARRYTPNEFPSTPEEAGLFDVDSSVTVYDRPPPEERVPDYPPPDL